MKINDVIRKLDFLAPYQIQQLREALAGETVYFPESSTIAREMQREKITCEIKAGLAITEIARRNKVSRNTIYAIASKIVLTPQDRRTIQPRKLLSRNKIRIIF